MLNEEIIQCEAKDKLVSEYLKLCIECSEPLTAFNRRHEILDRLDKIRNILDMKAL